MSAQATIHALLGGLATADPGEWRRKAARIAWVKETMARLRAAQKKVDAAWERLFEGLPDDISDEELEALDLPEPPEQAEVDAIFAELDAVRERDLWPRHLYFGVI